MRFTPPVLLRKHGFPPAVRFSTLRLFSCVSCLHTRGIPVHWTACSIFVDSCIPFHRLVSLVSNTVGDEYNSPPFDTSSNSVFSFTQEYLTSQTYAPQVIASAVSRAKSLHLFSPSWRLQSPLSQPLSFFLPWPIPGCENTFLVIAALYTLLLASIISHHRPIRVETRQLLVYELKKRLRFEA